MDEREVWLVMRIGSQDWYDMHPDAPTPGDLGDEREFERNAKRHGWNIEPPPVTGEWARALERSRQNAMAASREQ